MLSLVTLSGIAVADQHDSNQISAHEVEIKASFCQGNREHWSLHITQTGQTYFYYSDRMPMGTLRGEYFLEPETLATLVAEAQKHQFKQLPKKLQPAQRPIHAPDYSLEFRIGTTRHRVQIYHPAGLDSSPELDHFAAVWDAVWSQMHFRPPGVLTFQSNRAQ